VKYFYKRVVREEERETKRK